MKPLFTIKNTFLSQYNYYISKIELKKNRETKNAVLS